MKEQALTRVTEEAIVTYGDLAQAGMAANRAAARNVQERHQKKSSEETRRRHIGDIRLFCRYLARAGVERRAEEMMNDMQRWAGVTHGLVEGFVIWQEQEGYAIGSINVRLATVKTYCKLARQAGALTQETLGAILLVKGYRHAQGRNVDEQREVQRVGQKKAEATKINAGHAAMLKQQTNARDRLILCLLLDHGLRCSEAAQLLPNNFDLGAGTLKFYRHKVHKVQTHRLSPDTLIAAMHYLPRVQNEQWLFPGYKSNHISARMINHRVGELGLTIEVQDLSPHDLRHYWATLAAKNKTDIKALQTAGGWSSPAMPLRYVEDNEIANEGVKLL